ncbi:isoprenylcysteine carboxylmethyltransferase family protein [Streptomyces sp. TRM66268-LWL]|uniref:Isoprenylcysteine carboxylmethyltransferase family protein n=1 Tax=Streptomyces polyasparticus TaxID=2767826 RepID=A0ABR7SMA4_9ACTN|nr:isoprenylcysteine carboxylmethyltransferase family protein [Streptomyces polyasparticus]MBC9716117.1 isoprenylcysteine carboxylmethyltransferase family protein [Streptomyces polyasparticus]
MRKGAAAAGSAVFFVVAPGTVAGLVPWLLTGWAAGGPWWVPVRVVGWVLLVVSAAVLLHSFARFAAQGLGTPAPIAPTGHLVVTGAYRHVRNPMYVAVFAVILAQGLVLARPVLLGYGLLAWAVMAAFARGYEEPALREQFGQEYEDYRRAVRGWLPRLVPYRTGHADRRGQPPFQSR